MKVQYGSSFWCSCAVPQGTEPVPSVAHELKAPLAPDCVRVSVSGHHWHFTGGRPKGLLAVVGGIFVVTVFLAETSGASRGKDAQDSPGERIKSKMSLVLD